MPQSQCVGLTILKTHTQLQYCLQTLPLVQHSEPCGDTCLITVFLHWVSQLMLLANPAQEEAGLTKVVPQTVQTLVPQPHNRVHLTSTALNAVTRYNKAQEAYCKLQVFQHKKDGQTGKWRKLYTEEYS